MPVLRRALEAVAAAREKGVTMKRKTAAIFWPIVALLLALALGFVLAVSMHPSPKPATVEVVTRSGPSAAASISLVLFGIVGLFVLGAILAGVAVLVIRARQHAQQMEKAALLFGVRQPQQPPQRRPRVGHGDGPSVVIVSGGQGGRPRVEDFRNGYNG
jgi:hypothetical protein